MRAILEALRLLDIAAPTLVVLTGCLSSPPGGGVADTRDCGAWGDVAELVVSPPGVFSPAIAADGSRFMFEQDADLYEALPTSTGFGHPGKIPALATAATEGDPSLSADGRTVYFGDGGTGFGAMYRSHLVAGVWSEPVPITGATSLGGPDIDETGAVIYFDKMGQGGSVDLYVGRVDGDALTGVEALAVNGLGNDAYPSISADDRELYWSRDGALERSRRDSPDQPFDRPEDLGQNGDDPEISGDGETLYFDRNGIYALHRTCAAAP